VTWNPFAWHTRLGRWMAHSRLRALAPLTLAAIAGALVGAFVR
jgi:hypothetical protein